MIASPRRGYLFMSLVALLLLVVAFSSTASSAGPGSPVQQAKKAIAGATKVPAWRGPTKPVDMNKLKGKTILVMVGNSAIPFVSSTMAGAAEAAKAAGMKTVTFDGKGTPSEWLRGIEQGIGRKVDGIVMCGVPARRGEERTRACEGGAHSRCQCLRCELSECPAVASRAERLHDG